MYVAFDYVYPGLQLTSLQNTPDPTTPAGFMLRSNITDIVDIFEVNRKECARLLLEYPKWTLPGTFKARAGAPPQPVVENKNWELDNTLIEVRNVVIDLPAYSCPPDYPRLQLPPSGIKPQTRLLYCSHH